MNETRITVHGNVVTEPVEREGRSGTIFTTFRIATTPYRRLPDGRFLDGHTSFYNVIAFNALAANISVALKKGDPVVVEGNLMMKSYVGGDGVTRISPEVDADHVGHDLSWGRATFQRISRAAALGHERTSDPTVEAEMRALTEASTPTPAARPAFVDDDGVVADDYDPSAEPESVGDPDTDEYDVVDRMTA